MAFTLEISCFTASNFPWFMDLNSRFPCSIALYSIRLYFHHQTHSGSPGKNTGVGCHFLLQWTMFHQNCSLGPVHLGWPCIAWLLISWSYARKVTMTSLWSLYLPVMYHKHDQCLRLIDKIQKRICRIMSIIKIYPKHFILSHLEIKSLQILLE